MHKGVTPSLTSTEPGNVHQQRCGLLGIRGLTEMLVLRGQQVHHRFACGQYQVSLKSDIPGKNDLAVTARVELGEVVDALAEHIGHLETALDEFDSFTVALTASPAAINIIGAELDDHAGRLPQLRSVVRDWRNALSKA